MAEPTEHEQALLSKLEGMYQTVRGLKKELAELKRKNENLVGLLRKSGTLIQALPAKAQEDTDKKAEEEAGNGKV